MTGLAAHSRMPSQNQSVIFIGFIAVWMLITGLCIGLRGEHILLAVLLTTLFFAAPVSRRLVLALAPFAIFGISYDWMNLLPNYEVNTVDVGGIYYLEKSLFGITVNGDVLTPNEYFALHTGNVTDLLAGIFYLCWVPVPIAYGLCLYLKGKRGPYLHFALVFLLVNLIGFAGYYLHPAAPPWYVASYGADASAIPGTMGQTAGLGAFDTLTGWHVFSGLYSRNSNVFAALPSLHSAYVLIAFIYSIKARSPLWVKLALLVITCGIWWSAVYTSHHYIIDVVAGIFTACIGMMIFEYGLMKWKAFARFISRYITAITPPANDHNIGKI